MTLLLVGLLHASFVHAQSFVPPEQLLTKAQLKLIAQGFEIFTKETFGGNGRTCSTCHLPDKNYNITPADIAKMTGTQRDLVFATNTPALENATLVEKLALFNINEEHAPGNTNTPLGPFRSSMTLAGLALTTLNNFVCRAGQPLEADALIAAPNCALALAGTKNGVNKAFTIPNSTTAFGGVPAPDPDDFSLYRNGALLSEPADFMLSGSNVTMTVAPVAADRLVAYFPASGTPVDDGDRDIELGWAGNGALLLPSMFPAGTDCRTAVEQFAADRSNLNLALRTFALAAVKTHFPLTLNRVPNVDFRCPTSQELDAIAAFQQWLGRRFEIDLDELSFRKDFVETCKGPGVAEQGKAIFTGDKASCSACHVNAGASRTLGRIELFHPGGPTLPLPGANKNSPTGVDILRIREVILNGVTTPVVIPRDAGDKVIRSRRQADNLAGGGFNVQSLIEAPRKRTFFHNGAFNSSVEDAASFYFTDTFDVTQTGPGRVRDVLRGGDAGPTALAAIGGTDGLNKLGAFLRALSAYYSLADCERLVNEMIRRVNLSLPPDLPMIHCQFALNDVKYVLSNSKVSPKPYMSVVPAAMSIYKSLPSAVSSGSIFAKSVRLRTILDRLHELRKSIASYSGDAKPVPF